MNKNAIGDLGEAIFNVEISRDYLFRPRHLGEKWPSSDFYVELIGLSERVYFIVQIKSTTQGLDRNKNLKVKIPTKKLRELNNYHCPTYLAGVDVKTNNVYLISINTSKRKGLNNFPTIIALNKTTRKLLFNDVLDFWSNSGLKAYKRSFKHSI